MGVELAGKTLGLIGCGNIGSIVADRAHGLKMKVVAYDPFLSPERAVELGVDKVELDELLARADFITLHTPLTDQTRGILSREALAKTKPGVRIVNCARGGLIDEAALKDALDSGHVAGAALDVFSRGAGQGQRRCSARRGLICTPHLGASTNEAQVNVAIQVAEQMSDYPAARRHHQRGQRAVAVGRGSAAAEALHGARREARAAGRPDRRRPRSARSTSRSKARPPSSTSSRSPARCSPADGHLVGHGEHGQRALSWRRSAGIDVREIRNEREGDYHTLVAVTVGTEHGPEARRRHVVRQPRAAAGRTSSASRSRPSSPGR